jgi:hypothetical protein
LAVFFAEFFRVFFFAPPAVLLFLLFLRTFVARFTALAFLGAERVAGAASAMAAAPWHTLLDSLVAESM